ncbi:MAG: DNA-3-methyladenine glycosylase [Ruminococcaceae bacterium]|jgi:DNA-3-methyladenine glycosylase|nr:DNA-3-methyladenine glycosylase [Oscillospiraceae bacterium]
MARLEREAYTGDTVAIARGLVGRCLVRQYQGEYLVCRIAETEAYVGAVDKACHAYGYRKTARNAVMFGPPGHAYIYLIYGMHCCLNFVTNPAGEPDAVLLRGLVPLYGADTMARLRFGLPYDRLTPQQRQHLCDGPGKCCKALGLDRSMNGMDLTGEELFLCDSPADVGLPDITAPGGTVRADKRVGIDYAEEARDFLWRFIQEDTTC